MTPALQRPGDEAALLLEDGLRRFAREAIDARAIDREHRIPSEVLRGLAELGLFGLTLPESHGGTGASMRAACHLIAVLAEADRSVATTVGLHLGLGTRALVRWGSKRLKDEVLPELASGARIAAFSTTEPGAGSDLSALATTGVMDGDALVVNGEKVYVTNGGFAGVYTVAASTPGLGGAARGSSLLLVDRRDAGLGVGKEEEKLGLRGSSTTGLTFDGVRLPPWRVIGEPGTGAEQLAHVLSWGRTLMASGCCGTARVALKQAREHTALRKQFGKPLDQQEVVQSQLASLASRQFAMEALVDAVSALEDDVKALETRSLSAKVLCSEGAGLIVDTAIQLHGGSGFIEETGLPLLSRDARITRIFEGANDVLLTHAGATEAAAPTRFEGGETEVAALTAAHREHLTKTYRIKLLRQPAALHRLGRLVVLRDAVDAALARAAREGTAFARAAAAHFASQSAADARRLLENAQLDDGQAVWRSLGGEA